jgi:hypothetical protein
MNDDYRVLDLIEDLAAKSCVQLLDGHGLTVSDLERETVDWLRFRVEDAYRNGNITERDIMMAWLRDQGWIEIT